MSDYPLTSNGVMALKSPEFLGEFAPQRNRSSYLFRYCTRLLYNQDAVDQLVREGMILDSGEILYLGTHLD